MAPRFGIQLAPTADDLENVRELARRADRDGLDLLGIQDHPYAPAHVDAFSLIATVLAETERLTVFPDVASLPMRGPAMLAKTAASLDRLSGGAPGSCGRCGGSRPSGYVWPVTTTASTAYVAA